MQSAREPNHVVRFGTFEVELRSGELRKNGVKVKIQDLPFRALALLLNRSHEVVSREQFRQALWPDGVFVDFDHGISSAINRLRDALGDSADNPVFIETVERRGYRWIAPTQVPTPAVQPQLVVIKPERDIQEPMERSMVKPSWGLLLFPTLALILVVWGFWPRFRAASANTAKPKAVSQRVPDATHSAGVEAQQFYLKGRFYWQKRTPEGLSKALDYFTQAIVHDPNYAPAYVGLADCYNLMREYTLMPASEAYPRALAAARKAVELDDQSSEAHASLAFALFYGAWDAESADREFRRALDLDPNNAVAHHWYATYLSTVKRNSEALREIERAQALDPASKAILADKGDLLYIAGKREESLTLLKQLETAEPDFVSPHRYLKGEYLAEGDYPEYIDESRKEAVLLQDHTAMELSAAAKKGFASGGVNGMFQNMLTLQKKLYDHGSLSAYALAETYAGLGNTREALHQLKIAVDHHDDAVMNMDGDPLLKNLHNEPAYKDLLSRMGIPAQN